MTKSLEELKKDMRRNYSEKDLSIAEALDEAIEMGFRAGEEVGRNEAVDYLLHPKNSEEAVPGLFYINRSDLEAARTNKQEV